ncbi:MAG: TRAP transporter small permease subunit [Betaproteobacteria bacterium]|nr:MAG: TRAP transporter small permease subunit [Betaproteobacteria bacterium]
MNALIKYIERVTGSFGILASFALVPLVLATCYEVFVRYVMNAPTIWAYEVGYLLTGSHFLLGMAYTLREGEHIRIDVFSGKFSARTRAVIDLLGYCVTLPLMLWLSYELYKYLMAGYLSNEHSGSSAMNLPVWPYRIVFLVAFVLLALQIMAEVVKSARKLSSGSKG